MSSVKTKRFNLLHALVLLTSLIAVIPSSWAQAPARKAIRNSSDSSSFPRWITSERELGEHFESHVQRVRLLGRELVKRNPKLFSLRYLTMLDDFLSVHDRAKLDQSEAFHIQFWSSDEATRLGIDNFLHALITELYGISVYDLPDGPDKTRKLEIVHYLNEVDKKVGIRFFIDHLIGLNSTLAVTLKRIERIADVVDRNRDPVAQEEFGLTKRLPMSLFITDPVDLDLAEHLAEDYASITKGYSLAEVRERRLKVNVPVDSIASSACLIILRRQPPYYPRHMQ